MAVSVKPLIPSKTAENAQTTQYTAANVSAATLSVNLVTQYDSTGNQNLIVKTKTLLPNETYTFPELVGHILAPGGYISTIAGTASAINIRCSGREVS